MEAEKTVWNSFSQRSCPKGEYMDVFMNRTDVASSEFFGHKKAQHLFILRKLGLVSFDILGCTQKSTDSYF